MVFKICEGISCSSFSVKELDVIVHKKYFPYITMFHFGHSLANLVVEVGTRHCHQTLLIVGDYKLLVVFAYTVYVYMHMCVYTRADRYIHICWFNFDALAQGNAYKPTKEPINYRGPGGDRTHDLPTEATPPAASCPARTLHATELRQKRNSNDMAEAALDNWQPVWNAHAHTYTHIHTHIHIHIHIHTHTHIHIHTYMCMWI